MTIICNILKLFTGVKFKVNIHFNFKKLKLVFAIIFPMLRKSLY